MDKGTSMVKPTLRRADEKPGTQARTGALERGFHIVEVLIEAPAPMSHTDIATATGLEITTTQRLLQRLIDAGYVIKDFASKRFSASPRALFPMSPNHPLSVVRRETHDQLRLLRERYDETTCLVLFNRSERMLIDFVQGKESLSHFYDTWMDTPLHCSMTGHLLLLEMPALDRRRLLGPAPYEAHTPKTMTSTEDLERELELTRERGYAVARDTAFMGLAGVGAPIRGRGNIVGCLVMVGSSESIDAARADRLGEVLKGAANLITHMAPSLNAVGHFLGV
jgi:IclR family transcriptional regulator, acetate operon repressor